MSKKTSYENSFKAKVALEALRATKTVAEISALYNIASCLVSRWKQELEANASNAFGIKVVKSPEEQELKLYQQIGKLSMEVDYLKKLCNKYP